MCQDAAYIADTLILGNMPNPRFVTFRRGTEAYRALDGLMAQVAGEVNASGQTGRDTRDIAKSMTEIVKWSAILTSLQKAYSLLERIDGLHSTRGDPGKLRTLAIKICMVRVE